MSEESGAAAGGSSGEPVVSGRGTLTQESEEVRRIGAVLRGEKDAGSKDAAVRDAAGSGAVEGEKGEPADSAHDVEPGEGDAPEEVEAEAAGPLTLSELAKTLGVKEGELYDEVKVEVETEREDGTKAREAVSLGDLRRAFVGVKRLERDRESFEADSDKRSLEFMQTRAQLESLGALIAPYAPREVVERMEAQLSQRTVRERALLLDAVPEWKDAVKFTADRQQMIEHLKPWGFSPADVYAIGDHRIARYVRDQMKQEGRKAEAERKARQAGNGLVKRGQAPDGRVGVVPLRAKLANIVKAGRAAQTTEGKTQAIGALLRSGGKGK